MENAQNKVLVFGATGQVATELQRFDNVIAVGRAQADLSNPAMCAALIANTDADVVINAAAYTGVDSAETETELAFQVNADAPTEMAVACAARNIPFLHISTDYVFDGSGDTPWSEDDATGPLGVYGTSKRAGEQGIIAAGGSYAIMRTSWVVSAHGNNFVKTMMRLGAERDRLTIVADQIGGPTCARDIAGALMQMAQHIKTDPGKSGIYHYSGGPDVSWADFAREIFKQAGLACDVVDIPSSDYPTPAQRPGNSRMDCRKITQTFAIARPDWRSGITSIIDDLKADQDDKA